MIDKIFIDLVYKSTAFGMIKINCNNVMNVSHILNNSTWQSLTYTEFYENYYLRLKEHEVLTSLALDPETSIQVLEKKAHDPSMNAM